MKKCNRCHIEKELCEFNNSKLYSDGRRKECRECQKLNAKTYREKNREIINEKNRIQYKKNPEIQKEREKKWKINNPDSYKISNYKKTKKWVEKNKDKRREYQNDYNTKRLKLDTLFKLKRNVRVRINKFLKNKKVSSSDFIGCSFLYLKEHLEKQFINGMTWENYGEWHIDHKIPLSSANNEKDIYNLCHYINLQPLWAEDNLKKSNKIL